MKLPYTLLNQALKSSSQVVGSAKNASLGQIARKSVQFGPTKDLAIICGRAGVAGAVVDGSIGAFNATRAVVDGRLDTKGAIKHVAAEAGCGFATSSAGTAGTLAAYIVTGTMGPAALVAGMGASMGTRWAYRKVVGETLIEAVKAEQESKKTTKEEHSTEVMEEIGPEE